MLSVLLQQLKQDPALTGALTGADGSVHAIYNVSSPQRMMLSAAVHKLTGRPVLYVTASESAAARAAGDMDMYLGGRGVCASLGARDVLFTRAVSGQESMSRQLDMLSRMAQGKVDILCVPVDALMQSVMPRAEWWAKTVSVRTGDVYAPHDLIRDLTKMGYVRLPMVEGKGQCALRGDIVDVYPQDLEKAVRIEFFDDEVDIIRLFDPLTQRSTDQVEEAVLPPAALFMCDEEGVSDAWRQMIQRQLQREPDEALNEEDEEKSDQDMFSHLGGKQEYGITLKRTLDDCDALESSVIPPSFPLWAGALGLPAVPLWDYFPEAPVIVLDAPDKVRDKCDDRMMGFEEDLKLALERGDAAPEQSALLLSWDALVEKMRALPIITCQDFLRGMANLNPTRLYECQGNAAGKYFSRMQDLKTDIESWLKQDFYVLLCAGGMNRAQRLEQTLDELGIAHHEKLLIRPESLSQGFVSLQQKIAIISDSDIFGAAHVKRKSRERRGAGERIEAFTDLSVGDYVVHESHGVGIFMGTTRLQTEGTWRDYLLIQYQGNDKLYVPTDQFDRVQKFIGGSEDKPPQLNSLNSGSWDKQKKKVRASLQKLAFDLVRLYAERKAAPGYAFSADTPWQQEFEDAFPYELTPDQDTAIRDIKHDMESTGNMDRLLCGDVGYGKTEVALRAAFKCVMSGKQCALLAPTTILAQQHYYTMLKRFGEFPLKAEVLSRFRTPKQQKAAIENVKMGKVDILVGTHRLLSNDVQFKDLGLLIIDEEQRFGVAHKEKIKNMKRQVDVLTLSATPIPRTLHMSMVGVRDMSLLTTPPEERYPVQTYVMDYSDAVIRDAIHREVNRGGQVYFLYNHVQHIDLFAAHLRKMLPGVRIAVAHGQMKEGQLEDVMLDFFEHKQDVLLCSTIIENGVDVPNANTMIVYDADMFGLSQLYQLRGRVGRSNRAAFAYFTVRPSRTLSETAQKRLNAIREFTAFGSGFRIAMRDLEIRGAGNIFGPEQSGNVATVGYDLYCKMIEEAVREASGETGTVSETSLPDTRVELKVDAYLPMDYVHDESQRMEVFRRISYIRHRSDREDVIEELIDRFGDIPESVMTLIEVAHLRALCRRLYITRVNWQSGALVMRLDSAAPVENMYPLLMDTDKRLLFSAGRDAALLFRDGRLSVPQLMHQLIPALEKILQGISSPAPQTGA